MKARGCALNSAKANPPGSMAGLCQPKCTPVCPCPHHVPSTAPLDLQRDLETSCSGDIPLGSSWTQGSPRVCRIPFLGLVSRVWTAVFCRTPPDCIPGGLESGVSSGSSPCRSLPGPLIWPLAVRASVGCVHMWPPPCVLENFSEAPEGVCR